MYIKQKSAPLSLFSLLMTALILNTSNITAQETGVKEAPAREPATKQEPESEAEEIMEFMEDSMHEIDFYALEELLDTEVEVASLFAEDELVVSSTVSSITSSKWKMMGARRLHEAIGNEMSVVSFPAYYGAYIISIRGYTTQLSSSGVSILVDDVPLTDLYSGTPIFFVPNWDLGTIDRIEMIKGPGSAIYGSDAFHGVISMKTFESEKDHYSIEGALAHPLYGDGGIKLSQGFMGNLLRIDFTAAASYQADQNLEYEYDQDGFDLPPLVSIQAASGKGSRGFKHHSQTGTCKLTFTPYERLKFRAGAYYAKGKYDEYPGGVETVNPILPNNPTMTNQDHDLSWNESDFFMGKGSVAYSFENKISVEMNGYYWKSSKDSANATSPSEEDLRALTDDTTNRKCGKLIIKQPDNALNLQWLAAYSYTSMKVIKTSFGASMEGGEPIPGFPALENLSSGYSRNIHSVFVQAKWGAVKNILYIILGGRNDQYSDFGNQFTPRAGLIFLPTKKSSIKALYGRAFRAATSIEQRGVPGYGKGDPDIESEIIDIYELAYMYKEKKWKCSVNAFLSKWENGIILEDAPEGSGYLLQYVNKGRNQSLGGEAKLFYTMEPYALDLGFSFVKSYALDVDNPYEPGEKWDQQYRAFPEYSLNAGLYYTLKPMEINFYLNNIAYLNMKEAPESVTPNPDSLPRYFRTDLNVSKIVSDKLELYLNVRNLFNRENRRPSVYGAIDGYVEPGISVMARAGYKL